MAWASVEEKIKHDLCWAAYQSGGAEALSRMLDFIEPERVAIRNRPAARRRKPAQRRNQTTGRVYAIRDSLSGRVKIGMSKDPKARLLDLQTSCPGSLALLADASGGLKRERDLHRKFDKYRKSGEWFDLPDPVLTALVEELRSA